MLHIFLQLMLLFLMERFYLTTQEGYRSLFVKDARLMHYSTVTVGIFNNQKLIIN